MMKKHRSKNIFKNKILHFSKWYCALTKLHILFFHFILQEIYKLLILTVEDNVLQNKNQFFKIILFIRQQNKYHLKYG